MKLTIDTKEDSHEELRKVIKMLQALVDHPRTNVEEKKSIWDDENSFLNMPVSQASNQSQESNNMMGMFDSSEPKKEEEKKEETFDFDDGFKVLEY